MPDHLPDHLLSIDQGTTSTRAVVFTAEGRPVATAQREFPQHYPAPGWVEHEPEDIWRDTLAVGREALGRAGVPVRAVGIANQRETVVVWDRATGTPVHRAIVWQDRRTVALCARLREDGAEEEVRARTGLLLDPYFSATKLAWVLDLPGVRARAERGELLFGTVDSFLLWRLTGEHATDATNACRTLLFDIHRGEWCPELLRLFRVPAAMLPVVRDNAAAFGTTEAFGPAIPVCGMAGDQHAALVGQACLSPGSVKSTYGTGCFALLNTGAAAVPSRNRMLTTLAYRVGGVPTYAVEGAIFVAGAAVKWLRDGLGLITHASQTDDMATRVGGNHGVYMVPAFVGLGAPHWNPGARGAITGLTLDATAAHVARAALESVAYQTMDLLDAMRTDVEGAGTGGGVAELRVDGGMAANDWLCQFLADLLRVPVLRPAVLETTALGAAFLAGLGAGLYPDLRAAGANRAEDRRFTPRMGDAEREAAVAGWRDALRRTLL